MLKVLTVTNLWHDASSTWTSSETKSRLCWMKLCSSSIHSTTIRRSSSFIWAVLTFYLISKLLFPAHIFYLLKYSKNLMTISPYHTFSIFCPIVNLQIQGRKTMNCFCRMVDQRHVLSLIYSQDHCQRFSLSQTFNMLQVRFELEFSLC